MDLELRELQPEAVRFIEEWIDTVPHLEALLLLWESGSNRWAAQQVAARLYISTAAATSLLDDLVQRQLARSDVEQGEMYFRYECPWDHNGEQLARVAAVYRRQTFQVASLIHSKISNAVNDFARAFRLKKE